MLKEITTRKATGTWVVRTDNSVLGETRNAIELTESHYPPVIYFPREDLGMAFFEPSGTSTTCPLKGQATYFHMIGASKRVEDVAWSYENPHEDAADIAGHIAFFSSKVYVEQL